jgi:3-oxoacyl-[acyl-carrier-protein] synthase-3
MKACSDQNITRDDIDLFVFHQANMRINQYIADQIGAPEEKVLTDKRPRAKA